jgi:uncharacterized membrane protein
MNLWYAHLLLGPLMILVSYVFMRFPPKKINPVYGYRTQRSMRSQQAWDCANQYSAKPMLLVACATCLVQLVTYSLLSERDTVFWSAMFMAAAFVSIIPLTEIHLKNKGFK